MKVVSIFDDSAARERIRAALDESLVVEAAAGTGKTSELVARMVAALRTGRARVDRIAAVTFTRKAAGELKLRLRQELDRARAAATSPDEIRNLEHAIEHLEEARAGTIHSFCAEILRERPVEAGVDPAFAELSEAEAARIYAQAFRSWLEQKLGEDSPALRRALTRLASARTAEDEGTPADRLRAAGWSLIQWRDYRAAWRREPFALEAEIDALAARVLDLADIAARARDPRDYLARGLAPVAELAAWIRRIEAVRARDYEALETRLIAVSGHRDERTGRGQWFAEGIERRAVIEARDRLFTDLGAFRQRAEADLAAALRGELLDLVRRYDELKRRSGKLDFVDLLLRARDLVRGNAEVRGYLQNRFTHLFVDEFQDTDPLQVELLLLLAADDPRDAAWWVMRPAPGKLFLVGDPKQSIYRFRRADVQLYQHVTGMLQRRGATAVRLSKSYRSVRPIQEAVNAAFAPEMREDAETGQPAYVPLHEHSPAIAGQPAVIALPVPEPYGAERYRKEFVDKSLPEAAAAFIDWLVRHSGWKVRDPGDPARFVPVSERHVCVLFRRFLSFGQDVTREYTRALEARNIAHVLVGARSFHSREEVETLRAALAAIEWPDDELSVFAALKGSLFAIPDAALLRFRQEIGSLHPLRPLPEGLAEELAPAAEALALLASLHRGRNYRPVVATVNALLEATRAHAAFALRPAGNQVLANVHRIADLARSFELSGGLSFRGFVEELEAQAEAGEESVEAPVIEESAGGVRLMTVHKAKGLEFPVVVLADATAKIARKQAELYVDGVRNLCAMSLLGCAPWELIENQAREQQRDAAEGVRVAYVAATRARDLLVIPGFGDRPYENNGWLTPLNKAIYPPPERRRQSSAATGCPPFGEDTVLTRPPVFRTRPEDSVRPGLHRIGEVEVVWWDPRALRLGAPPNFGLRQQEILAEDEPEAAAESIRRHQEWKARRTAALEQGGRATFDIFTPTDWGEAPEAAARIRVAAVAKPEGRPSGPRFGALVHGVLSRVPLEAKPEAIEAVARVEARVYGAPPVEVEAAVEAVRAALAHPLLDRARAAARFHRELPVMAKLGGGRVVEGIIDLAYLEDGAWTVVDFKTDAELSLARYRRQLGWYVHALAGITGQPAEGWLLSV